MWLLPPVLALVWLPPPILVPLHPSGANAGSSSTIQEVVETRVFFSISGGLPGSPRRLAADRITCRPGAWQCLGEAAAGTSLRAGTGLLQAPAYLPACATRLPRLPLPAGLPNQPLPLAPARWLVQPASPSCPCLAAALALACLATALLLLAVNQCMAEERAQAAAEEEEEEPAQAGSDEGAAFIKQIGYVKL